MPYENEEFAPISASALSGAEKYEFEHMHDHADGHVHDEEHCEECAKEH